jgi:hypothetical protein
MMLMEDVEGQDGPLSAAWTATEHGQLSANDSSQSI